VSTELRRVCKGMYPQLLEDLGLQPALQRLCAEMSTETEVEIDLQFDGFEPASRLTEDLNIALYRIAQEGLSNVIRHAGAGHATLQVRREPQQVVLALSDDGRGMALPQDGDAFSGESEHLPSGSVMQPGLGFASISDRVASLGGTLRLHSSPGAGTRLEVSVPLPAPL